MLNILAFSKIQGPGSERLHHETWPRSGNPTRRPRIFEALPHPPRVQPPIPVRPVSQKYRQESGQGNGFYSLIFLRPKIGKFAIIKDVLT